MNIAIFASAFYPHFGGVEEACRHLALEYQRRGHHVVIVTTRHPQSLPAQETVQGVDVRRFPFPMPRANPAGMLHFARHFPAERCAVAELLRAHAIDVIHVQCVGPNGFYALWAAQDTGLPLVVTTQGERTMDAGRLYQKSLAANWTLRRLLHRADYVTACSRQTLEDAQYFAGFPIENKSCPVYNGIALEEFGTDAPPYSHPRPYILGIGRIVPQKGFDILIDAYAKLIERVSNAPDLILAGDGPERERLEAKAKTLKLASRVFFIGQADRPQAVSLFQGCALFVLPSRQEPQGIVSLEAMACAKPVVAARVGGVPEIVVDGETGLLTDRDIPAFAAALDRILSDPELGRRMGSAGRERARSEWSWSRSVDVAESWLHRAVKERR